MQRVRRIASLLLPFLICALFFGAHPGFAYDRLWDSGHNTTNKPKNPPYNPPKDPCEKSTGSPVYLRVGNLILGFTDMSLTLPDSPVEMEIHRNYNNQEKYNGPFGYGWVTPYTTRLVPVVKNNTIEQVIIRKDLGKRIVFVRQPDGSYTPDNPDSYDSLVLNPDGTFTLNPTCPSCGGFAVEYGFSAEGFLTSMSDANGNGITFEHDDSNRLVKATDSTGRFFSYTYGDNDKVTQISDSSGRKCIYEYDSNDNLIKATNPAGNLMSYGYDTDHNLIAVTDPNGNTALIVTYDTQDRVATYTQYGDTVTFSYDDANYRTTKTDSLGHATTYTYDPTYGVVTKITYSDGAIETYAYDERLNLVSFTDGRGNITTYTYDENGHRLSVTDALGNVSSYAYDATGRRISETSARGVITKYEYDANGNLTTKYQAWGTADQISETFTYDASGHRLTFVDANGNTTSYTYDAAGNRTSITDPEGFSRTYTYDDMGRKTAQTDAAGNTTQYEYDTLGRVVKVTDPLGHVKTMQYDDTGNVIASSDFNGNTTTYEYNFFNQLVKQTDPLGHVKQMGYTERGSIKWMKKSTGDLVYFQYNGRGRMTKKIVKIGDTSETPDDDDLVTNHTYDLSGNRITTVLPNGVTYLTSYDAVNRISTKTLPTGEVIAFSYDADGNLTKKVNGHGLALNYEFDNLNRVTRIYDANGTMKTYTHDGLGHPLTQTYGNGTYINFTYDKRGKLLRRTYPDGSFDLIDYDAAGRIKTVTDRGGKTVTRTYDGAGRVLTSTDGLNHVTSATYDGANLLSLTDANGNTTSFSYDAAGNKTGTTMADGNETQFSYDANNRLASRTAPDGTITAFTYNERSLLVKRDYPGDNDDIFTYGPANELLSAANSDFTVTRAYDDGGRLTSETINGKTITYSYDTENLTRTITRPGGRTTTETFDARERPTGVNDENGSSIVSYVYNDLNKRTSLSFKNGVTAAYGYDTMNLKSSVIFTFNGSTIAGHDYTRRQDGRILAQKNKVDSTASEIFDYDISERLIGFSRGEVTDNNGTPEIASPTRAITFGLDAASNIIARTVDGSTEQRTANVLNQYLTAGTASLVHDLRGNLTDDGVNLYAYDAMNRLLSVTRKADSQVLATLKYDALGRLGSVTANGSTTTFYYDQRQRIIEEDTDGTVSATYVYGLGTDEALEMQRGGNAYYLLHDVRGNVIAATDAAGDIVERYAYDPYGGVTITNGSGTVITQSAVGNPYLFKGARFIPETGLYYMRARFYSPALNRFMTRDPSGFNTGLNLYIYAMVDPVNFSDPTGLAAKPSESCVVSDQIVFNIDKLKAITKVISAFGADFEVGGGVAVTASACKAKCCKKQITYVKWDLTANLKMAFEGVVPGLGVSVPKVGKLGVIGHVEFGIAGSGTFAQSFDKNCNITCASKVCVGVYGKVGLELGVKLDDEVEIGIDGTVGVSGQVCYGCSGWEFRACANGKIELVAKIEVFWITVGGSFELVGAEVCTSNLKPE